MHVTSGANACLAPPNLCTVADATGGACAGTAGYPMRRRMREICWVSLCFFFSFFSPIFCNWVIPTVRKTLVASRAEPEPWLEADCYSSPNRGSATP